MVAQPYRGFREAACDRELPSRVHSRPRTEGGPDFLSRSQGSSMSSPLADNHVTSLVEITRREGILLVKPTGPSVGQREAPIIQDEVKPYFDAMGQDLEHLVLDMSSTTFMSSMGLGMCIAFRNTANALKADSILFGLSKELLGLMSMMKIEKYYKIAKNQKQLDKLLR